MKNEVCKIRRQVNYVNCLKRVRYSSRFLIFLLLFAGTMVYAQSDDKIKVPLENLNDKIGENSKNKRNIENVNILPTVLFDVSNNSLSIISQYETYDLVTYYILDEFGQVWQHGEMILPEDVEIEIGILQLPKGLYYVVLEFSGSSCQGEFYVN